MSYQALEFSTDFGTWAGREVTSTQVLTARSSFVNEPSITLHQAHDNLRCHIRVSEPLGVALPCRP
jgi:hypothetical protein